MAEQYMVWLCNGDSSDDAPSMGTNEGFYQRLEGAVMSAKEYVFRGSYEMVLVIAVAPWESPRIEYMAGVIPGKECSNWYQMEKTIVAHLKSAKEHLSSHYQIEPVEQEVV